MHGAAAQRGRERYRRAKEAQEAKVRAAVELERARRVAAKEAEMKKRSIKNLLAMADRGAMGSLFQIWDRDGSGYIDRDEFDGQVVALGHEAGIEITSEMLDLAWADFDLDGSGSVTYEEWLRIMLRDVLAQGSGKIVDAFRAMDDDNSGAVNRNEFCDAIVAMGVDAPRILVEEVFDSMDVDGSGTLTFAELYKQIRPGSSDTLKTRSAQAMRIAALPPPRRDPHKVLNNVSMTKIQARIGPATCYIVPKVTDPDRSIDDDGTACWVCVHRSAGMRH